jgi:hypothetical protein
MRLVPILLGVAFLLPECGVVATDDGRRERDAPIQRRRCERRRTCKPTHRGDMSQNRFDPRFHRRKARGFDDPLAAHRVNDPC